MKTRKCKDCEETQPIENFDKDYRGCTRTRCRPCQKLEKAKQKKKYYYKNKDAILKQAEAHRRSLGIIPREVGVIHDETICRVCEVIIPQDELSPTYKGKRRAICKPCLREQRREQYATDVKKRQYHKDYYQANKEKQKESVRLRREKNPDKIREYKNRPECRIRKSQAKRIRKALAVTGTAKTYKTLDLVGCTAPELKKHLEGQFAEGMTWDNYGLEGWHIDHIKPLSSFDLTDIEQQKICFHFSNLQPLWAADNLAKGAGRFD